MSNKPLLQPLGDGQGFLKAGFQGFQGSGKTYTATLLAIGTRELFKLTGPVAFVDTENATEYIAPLVQELTGQGLIGNRTRDFQTLLDIGAECEKQGVAALVVDSMTHFWRSLCDAHLAGVNRGRARYNKPPKRALEFQDWAQVKNEWARWTDWYLNSPMHVIICGRAGFEYDMAKNEDTGRNELIKTGTKMKTEAEFGFEPSLLVEMACEQEPDPKESGRFIQVRTAQVLKDRFAVIDGERLVFQKAKTKKAELAAVMKAFGPHVQMLKPGSHSTVITQVEPLNVDEDGDNQWRQDQRRREILLEEIKGVLIAGGLDGASADAKKRRMELLVTIFGTRSWSAIETFDVAKLRDGLASLRKACGQHDPLITDQRGNAPDPEDDVQFGKPAAVHQTAVAGTPAIAPPSPPASLPSSPPAPAQPKQKGGATALQTATAPAESSLPFEIQKKVAEVVGSDAKLALDWLRKSQNGKPPWLGPDQGFEDLSLKYAKAIVSGGNAFRRTIGAKVEVAA